MFLIPPGDVRMGLVVPSHAAQPHSPTPRKLVACRLPSRLMHYNHSPRSLSSYIPLTSPHLHASHGLAQAQLVDQSQAGIAMQSATRSTANGCHAVPSHSPPTYITITVSFHMARRLAPLLTPCRRVAYRRR